MYRVGPQNRATDSWPYTHTHPFNGPFSGTTQVSQYQRGKTNLDFTEARDSWPYFCQILTDFLNFFTVGFLSKFAVKWILNIPTHFAHVATLPCETLMSAKQAINDKLQCSVATYLRCGGVVKTKLRKVYCWVCEWKNFKIGEYLAKLQARTWLFRVLSPSFSSALAKHTKCTRQSRSCFWQNLGQFPHLPEIGGWGEKSSHGILNLHQLFVTYHSLVLRSKGYTTTV